MSGAYSAAYAEAFDAAALVGWVDLERDAALLVEAWPDSTQLERETLEVFLAAAYQQCETFAPPIADAAAAPERYVLAQILQAEDLWSATRRDGDVIGYSEQVVVRVRPLGNTVKSLLRPKPARPRVG